ncbi:MAG TPA: hypothetical protein DCM57_05715 [Treponema sp.]|nr:hypothetical protein [Treponema sp.]HBB42666.1 hypothetical protein [Treponema sp.]
MRRTKIITVILASLFTAMVPLAADGLPENMAFSIGVDFAYYPKSDHIAGSGDTFAPITGAYSGIEGRVTGNISYSLPTPLGESWLVKDANVVFNGKLELTPVSVKPGISVSFTPLPFLVFSAGFDVGTGWDLGTLFKGGMASLSTGTNPYEYNALPAFAHWFLKPWFQATFQFDTGAIFKGDWTHVVMQASYQAYYEGITGMADGEIWKWQLTGNKVNGWKQYINVVVAYQMPLVIKRAGILFEWDGYYSPAAYNTDRYGGYDAAFMECSIGPLAQFEFNEHHNLTVLFGFSSRRRFSYYNPEISVMEPTWSASGREWYFKRLALSYTYKF